MKIPLSYDCSPGTSIHEAFEEALDLSKKKNRPVQFWFNQFKFKVHKRLSIKHLLNQWRYRSDAHTVRYWSSPEGQEYMARIKDEIRRKQEVVDYQLSILDQIFDDQNVLMLWLQRFTQHANNSNVYFSHSDLATKLESYGFVQNYGAGKPKEWFSTRHRLAKFIIGQVLVDLNNKKTPHQVVISFVEKYFDIPQDNDRPIQESLPNE